MTTNPGKQVARRVRLKAVESAMIAGTRTGDICAELAPQFKVSRDTIRRDIKAVSKAHQKEIFALTELESTGRYLAACIDLRRQAVEGVTVLDQYGNIRITGRDLKLAHQLDQEIARLRGMSVDGSVNMLVLQKYRTALEEIMVVVFSIVRDQETKNELMAGFERLDEQKNRELDPRMALIAE